VSTPGAGGSRPAGGSTGSPICGGAFECGGIADQSSSEFPRGSSRRPRWPREHRAARSGPGIHNCGITELRTSVESPARVDYRERASNGVDSPAGSGRLPYSSPRRDSSRRPLLAARTGAASSRPGGRRWHPGDPIPWHPYLMPISGSRRRPSIPGMVPPGLL
jgi:hypothetical protein